MGALAPTALLYHHHHHHQHTTTTTTADTTHLLQSARRLLRDIEGEIKGDVPHQHTPPPRSSPTRKHPLGVCDVGRRLNGM